MFCYRPSVVDIFFDKIMRTGKEEHARSKVLTAAKMSMSVF
jgi:hypothetical protein